MRSLLQAWLRRRRATTVPPPSKHRRRSARLEVEALEPRDVPAATDAFTAQVRLDAQQLGQDVVQIEAIRPTPCKQQLLQDAQALGNDALGGSLLGAIYLDEAKLAGDMSTEGASGHGRQSRPLSSYPMIWAAVMQFVGDWQQDIQLLEAANPRLATTGNEPATTVIDGGTLSFRYAFAAGSLFGGGVSPTDVTQGYTGDCAFLATLAAIAQQDPALIGQMIAPNGDGTYTVRFYTAFGTPQNVTVDGYLPEDAQGHFAFADNGQALGDPANKLWVPLIEKAWAVWQGGDSYQGIAGLLWSGQIMAMLTGSGAGVRAAQALNGTSQRVFSNALAQHDLVVLTSQQIGAVGQINTVAGYQVVSYHAYAVLGYNPSAGTFIVYNPWGYGPAAAWAGASPMLLLTWDQLNAVFAVWDVGPNPAAVSGGGQGP
jgi:hypothetical protein